MAATKANAVGPPAGVPRAGGRSARLRDLGRRRRRGGDLHGPVPMPTAPPLRDAPWLRWPEEGARPYEAFALYRDLPPARRSREAAYVLLRERLGKGPLVGHKRVPGSWCVWSRRFWWVERVAAWDAALDRLQSAERLAGYQESYRQMSERHAQEAMAMQAKGMARLRSLDPEAMSADEVRKYVIGAAAMERVARGGAVAAVAQAKREREAQAPPVAVITYVDDWGGQEQREREQSRLRQQAAWAEQARILTLIEAETTAAIDDAHLGVGDDDEHGAAAGSTPRTVLAPAVAAPPPERRAPAEPVPPVEETGVDPGRPPTREERTRLPKWHRLWIRSGLEDLRSP